MNQLLVKESQLQFLNKTNEDINEYIGIVYEETVRSEHPFYEGIMDNPYIPTRNMLLRTSWDHFEGLYLDYIKNGHGGAFGAEILERLEDGEDEMDIITEWSDWKGNNASYGSFFTEEQTEKALLTDVAASLLALNMSYLKDSAGDNLFYRLEDIKVEEWINPSIARVW